MSEENIHTEASFQTWLDLDRNWNPIQDAYDQCGYGPPLDDSLADEFQDTGYTFRWKNCPSVVEVRAADPVEKSVRGTFLMKQMCRSCHGVNKTLTCMTCGSDDTVPVLVLK